MKIKLKSELIFLQLVSTFILYYYTIIFVKNNQLYFDVYYLFIYF